MRESSPTGPSPPNLQTLILPLAVFLLPPGTLQPPSPSFPFFLSGPSTLPSDPFYYAVGSLDPKSLSLLYSFLPPPASFFLLSFPWLDPLTCTTSTVLSSPTRAPAPPPSSSTATTSPAPSLLFRASLLLPFFFFLHAPHAKHPHHRAADALVLAPASPRRRSFAPTVPPRARSLPRPVGSSITARLLPLPANSSPPSPG